MLRSYYELWTALLGGIRRLKALLTRTYNVMQHAIDEGRHAVCSVRSSQSFSTELEEAFSRIQDETPYSRQNGERPNFRVFREGSRKLLPPVIRDEVYGIGREA